MNILSATQKLRAVLLCILGFQLLTACSEPPTQGQQVVNENSKTAARERMAKVFKSVQAQGDFMGSVALLHHGQLLYSDAYGFADVSRNLPLTVDSKFRLGSLSKTYTASLVFQAIAQGRLTLDQTIANDFPEIVNASQIRIADLLQHRSGIPSYTQDKQFFSYHTEPKTQQQMLQLITRYGSEFAPNSRAEYSNSNYYLLACILERVYQQPYADILQQQVLTPLSLTQTYAGGKVQTEQGESLSYRYAEGWQLLPQTDMSLTLGAGNVVANALDVAEYFDTLLSGKWLAPEQVKMMQTVTNGFGMGLMPYELAGRTGFGHRGTLDGYRATAIYFPKDEVTLVLLANGEHDNINQLYEALLKAYFNDAIQTISAEELEKFVGIYVNTADSQDSAEFVREGSTLVHVVKGEFKTALTYKGQQQFLFEQVYGPSILFTFTEDGQSLLFEQGTFRGTFSKAPH